MTLKFNINEIVKALACLAFVFSLVMLPPSSSHADHAAMVQSEHATMDHSSMGHVHADVEGSNTSDEQTTADDTFFGCCSGICVSVVLMEEQAVCAQQPVAASFGLEQTQARSVAKAGALRPPRTTV
jgi:hypothetical protein